MRMLPIFWFVVVGSLFFGRKLLLQVVNDLQWKSTVLGYCMYDLPFLLFILFCNW